MQLCPCTRWCRGSVAKTTTAAIEANGASNTHGICTHTATRAHRQACTTADGMSVGKPHTTAMVQHCNVDSNGPILSCRCSTSPTSNTTFTPTYGRYVGVTCKRLVWRLVSERARVFVCVCVCGCVFCVQNSGECQLTVLPLSPLPCIMPTCCSTKPACGMCAVWAARVACVFVFVAVLRAEAASRLSPARCHNCSQQQHGRSRPHPEGRLRCNQKRYSRPCLPLLWPRLYAEPFGLGEKRQPATPSSPHSPLVVCRSGAASDKISMSEGQRCQNALSPLILGKNDHLYHYLA